MNPEIGSTDWIQKLKDAATTCDMAIAAYERELEEEEASEFFASLNYGGGFPNG